MGRQMDLRSEVEEQLVEATASLLKSLETKDLRPVAKAVQTLKFAQMVNQGKARDRRKAAAIWDGKERRAALLIEALLAGVLLFVAVPVSAAEGFATYYTTASCKAEGTSGIWTASKERFNEKALTCALRRHDFGKEYLVYSPDTNRSIVVKHNDFGPSEVSYYQHGNIIDLTPAAMKALGIKGRGRVFVQEVK